MIKKVSAILVALMMLLSMSFVVSAEATGTIELTMAPEKVFYDTEATEPILFDVNVVLKGAPSVGAFSFKLDYDKNVIVPVNTGTTTDAMLTGKAVANHFGETEGEPNWYVASEAIGDGTFNYVGMFNSTNPLLPTASAEQKFDVPAEGLTCYTITFKVKASGATGLALTVIDNVCFTLQPTDVVTISNIDVSKVATINAKPVAPTATTLGADTSAPVEGGTVAPTYTWNNGLTDTGADITTNDGSEVTWYAGTTELGKTTEKADFIVPAAAVGKELSYTILPKVAPERDIASVGTVSDKVVVGNVAAISTYAPAVTAVELDNGAVNAGEILASTTVTAVPTTDTTYDANEVKTYTFAYEWYAVDFTADETKTANDAITAVEAYTADTETLVKLESTTAEATFDAAEYKDWFAVVKVTPSVTIAGETEARLGAAKCAAAKVTGEPPVLADDAEAAIAKLAAKKFFTSSTADATTVKFDSNVVEGAGDTELINYSYAWYLTSELKTADTFDAAEATAITAEDALKTAGKVKLSKVEGAEGKYLVVVITATDALGIEASTTVCFTNPIKKATGGSGTQGGASLVTGNNGAVVEPDEPAVEPEKDPADPAGEANDKGATVFTDVDKEVYAWGYDYLDKLAKAGVVKGMTETTYAPEEETTYAQFTALVVRVLGLTAEEAATEKVAADHWSFAEVSVADKLGILADVAFDADKAITREDMAAIAHKALVAKAVELKAGEAVEYTDASAISEYAAAAIDAMSKAGILNGMGDGTFAPKGTTTRMQTAKVIGMISELIG